MSQRGRRRVHHLLRTAWKLRRASTNPSKRKKNERARDDFKLKAHLSDPQTRLAAPFVLSPFDCSRSLPLSPLASLETRSRSSLMIPFVPFPLKGSLTRFKYLPTFFLPLNNHHPTSLEQPTSALLPQTLTLTQCSPLPSFSSLSQLSPFQRPLQLVRPSIHSLPPLTHPSFIPLSPSTVPTTTTHLHLARGWSHSLKISSTLAARAYDTGIPFTEEEVITSNCIAECVNVVALNSVSTKTVLSETQGEESL